SRAGWGRSQDRPHLGWRLRSQHIVSADESIPNREPSMNDNGPSSGYHHIKERARQTGLRISELLALAPKNDPFYAGSPAQRAKAEWFAGLWQRFGYTRGVHLRRIHYQHVSQHSPTRHDGMPYQNTEGCWALLGEASKAARCLGLVSPDAFEDHRNPDPQLF